jgi:DNA-binding helix-hairpin-helix protein with protein kinase domain
MAEAQQLSALEAEADKAAAAADLKRLNAKKQKELKAEIARKREQDKQEFLKRQSLMQSKGIAKFIAERAAKFPDKFGVTMSDDLDSYLAKTKPLWFALWDGLLPDGQEIPAVFYEVLKENMRKRIPN